MQYSLSTTLDIDFHTVDKTPKEPVGRLSPIKSSMFEKPPSEEPVIPPGKILLALPERQVVTH